MKKNFLKLFMLLCVVSTFTACSGDEDDNNKLPEPIGDEITGVYLGALNIDVKDLPLGDAGKNITQKIYITKTGDNSLELQLKNFSFGETPMGNIAVENCIAQKTQDGYSFTGSKKGLVLAVGSCDIDLSGTIVGKTANVTINVVAVQSLHVKVDFQGEKLDKDLSSEASMLTFTIDNDKIIGQPVISEDGTVKFSVSKEMTDEELSQLAPEFTISENASVSPASGEVQDFSEGKSVTYTITSQDGIVVNKYVVSVGSAVWHYSFDKWDIKSAGNYEFDYIKNTDWDSSNSAVTTLKTFGYYDKNGAYPIAKLENGKVGFAASITTLDSKGGNLLGQRIPKITAGTLFTGQFTLNMSKPLQSTKFGISFSQEPVSLKGYYKYAPGKDYYQVGTTIDKATIDVTKSDECSIVAVLYEATSADYTLTGENLNDESLVVLRAELFDSKTVSDWTEFSIPFEAKNGFVFDASKSYKLAIVCSSSKNGASYSGAPGSVLMVDEFEVVTK